MVRGQRKGKALTGLSKINECPSRKNTKSEFRGKLSHTSPSAKITSYYTTDVPNVPVVEKSDIMSSKVSPHRIDLKVDEMPIVPQPPLDTPVQTLKKQQRTQRRLKVIQSSNEDKKTVESCKDSQNKLTNYFPVRRSVRKTKKTVLEEIQKNFEEAVLSQREDGLEIHMFEGKGRGVVATRCFSRGDFVVEYAGELISLDKAKEREYLYSQDQNTGCYMYYFTFKNNQYCVDATAESYRLGRLVNHSRNGNLITKTVIVNGQPHLVLVAKEDIKMGDELTYDYGDRSKESLRHHPWLAF